MISRIIAVGGFLCLALSTGAQNTKFYAGMCTHFAQGKGEQKNFAMLKELGVNSIRDEAYWECVEKEKGILNLKGYLWYVKKAAAKGINPLTVLSFSNKFYDNKDIPQSTAGIEGYTRYCEAVAKAFKGKSKFYEIWNEWDAGFGGRGTAWAGKMTPESYIKVIKAVYPRLKKVVPDATILAGAATSTGVKSGWIEGIVKAGAMKYCDAISVHTYVCKEDALTSPEYWRKWMIDLHSKLVKLNNEAPVPLVVTEMGWPNQIHPKKGVSPEVTAAYIARTYLLARTLPFIKGIWWYDFQNDGWRYKFNEDNFGIVRPDLTPKSAYFAFQSVADIVTKADFVRRVDAGNPDIWILEFKMPDGEKCWTVWSAHKDHDWQIIFKDNSGNRNELTLQKAGRKAYKADWGYRNWGDGLRDAVFRPNELSLTVRSMPWIIKGDLSNIFIKKVIYRQYPETTRGKSRVIFMPKQTKVVNKLPADYKTFWGKKLSKNLPLTTLKWEPFACKKITKNDCSGSFGAFYSGRYLYLVIKIIDDVHIQTHYDDGIWKEDSVQIAVKSFASQKDREDLNRFTELGVALKDKKVYACRYASQQNTRKGQLSTVKAKILRNTNSTVYWLKLPYCVLDIPKLNSGTIFGFSLLINESDGKRRKGYLHWGGGIGKGKNPLEYNWMIAE